MTLRYFIFSLFGDHEKLIDSNKDLSGKGTLERYNEAVGDYYDEALSSLIDSFVAYQVHPQTVAANMLLYLEGDYGNTGLPYSTDAQRRTIQRNIVKYYSIRGTKRAYTLLLNLLGFDVEITEYHSSYTFDSPTTFDDDVRTFDLGKCAGCSSYSLNLIRLSGNDDLTDEEITAITTIIKFNEPINARITGLTLDGTDVADFNYDYSLDFLS